MQEAAQDFILRRVTEELGGFTAEAFRLGLSLAGPDEERCSCGARREDPGLSGNCRAFWSTLATADRPRQRCPAGLTVVARSVDLAPGRRLLLAAEGYLPESEAGPPGPGGAVPCLSEEQVRLLEAYVDTAASLLRTLWRSAREASTESQREDGWLDLAGAPSVLGVSEGVRALREALATAANSREPILLEGEAGSGRGLLAATLHRLGPRRDGPFVRESVTALPDLLHESELFGDGNGNPGLLGEAAGGTLYLAGVDRLQPAVQKRLAALLGRGAGDTPAPDVRIVASVTGVKGRGRGLLPALGERLGTLRLSLPPLRDRAEDIPLLVEHLLARRAAALGTPPVTVTPEAMDALRRHTWDGNVRELDDELARAAAGRDVIRLEDLPHAISRRSRAAGAAPGADLRQAVGELEREMIENALGETGWNKSRAAVQLGLSRLGLQKKIDRYRIDRRRPGARVAAGGSGP